MAPRLRRHAGIFAVLATVAIAAACVPVTPPPAPKPPPTPPPTTLPANCPTTAAAGAEWVPDADDYVAVVDVPTTAGPEIVTFTASSQAEVDAKVAELEQQGSVVSVEQDQPVAALAPVASGDDPQFGLQWGLTRVGFPAAWSRGLDGAGVTIAVIDTGVQASHPDLQGRVVAGRDFVCTDATSGVPGGGSDPHGHGTHVAGIAAAGDNAVFGLGGAPRASILSVRVLNKNGAGGSGDVAQGITWAVDHGADVINLSLGGSGSDSAMEDAVAYAESQSVVVVAALGNSASFVPGYPAGYDAHVIAVGASDTGNNRASFSNYAGPVDLGAPGTSIWSTYPTSTARYLNGTSMSTPFVSAAAALLHQHCPAMSPDGIQSRLEGTATTPIGGSPPLGANLLNVDAATADVC